MTTQATAAPAPAAGTRPNAAAWFQEYGVYAAVAALLLFNALFTDHFLTADNLRTQLVQVAPIVIVALGMALVIGTEGVDLSVGSAMALATALLPLYLGYGLVPALLVALSRAPSSARSTAPWSPWWGCNPSSRPSPCSSAAAASRS